MAIVLAKINNHVWDNHQGGSGTISVEIVVIEIARSLDIKDLRRYVIDFLDGMGKCDNWGNRSFTGAGLVCVKVV